MVRSERMPRFMSAEVRECARHGEFTSFLLSSGWSGCLDCKDEADAAAREAEQVAWRRELQERAWKDRMGRAAIPERFSDRRLDTYKPTCPEAEAALRSAKAYAAGFANARAAGACLILVGTVGTGKTHLAVGIAHEVLAQGGQAVFTSVRGAVQAVKETWDRGAAKKEADVLREMVSPDLLILDEVGVQFGSDTEKLILFDIINGRYEARRPTIVISNLAVPELEKYLGSRAFDRLREGGGKLIACTWESYRSRGEA